MEKRIIGIDPGSEESGMVVLDDSTIIGAFNLRNEYCFYDKVTNFSIHPNLTVVIEDLKPYSLRLTPQVISTAKFIGECLYRLKNEAGMNVTLVSRNEVKKWVFDTFPEVCLPIIEKAIGKKGYITRSTGEPRKPSFVFVNDKIVTESMKVLYKIPLPKSGKGYQHGLQSHSWQALGLASFFSTLPSYPV